MIRRSAALLGSVIASRYFYVVVNSLISFVVFGRNFLFMNAFGLADVGQIALMQTIIMLVGFLQLGFISGAYILWAGGDRELNRQIVNILFVGKVVLIALSWVAFIVVAPSAASSAVAPETLTIGLAAGVASLAANWMNNTLIADQRLAASSLLNALSALISLGAAAIAVTYADMTLALLAVAVQPIIVMIGALIVQPDVRPVSVKIDPNVLRRVFAVGARPFFATLAALAIYQAERWAIFGILGTETLGRYYIVTLYLSLFVLVPSALLNVYFPRAMKALKDGDQIIFEQFIKRHMTEVFAYVSVALIGTILVLPKLLSIVLPQYAGSDFLLILAFVASAVLVVQDTGTLVLYATENTKPLMAAGIISLAAFAIPLTASLMLGSFSLESVLLARIVSALAGTIYMLAQRHKMLNFVRNNNPQ